MCVASWEDKTACLICRACVQMTQTQHNRCQHGGKAALREDKSKQLKKCSIKQLKWNDVEVFQR